jgi:hypothetical protein
MTRATSIIEIVAIQPSRRHNSERLNAHEQLIPLSLL